MKSTIVLAVVLLTEIISGQNYTRDIKMGEKASKEVEREMGFYKHDSLERIVKGIGNRLVKSLDKKTAELNFQFFLVDSEEPNAFALPGGFIYVTRGILPIIQSEDELAGILAHEIIHVVNRHSVKQVNKAIVPAVLKIPGNLVNAFSMTHLTEFINLPIEVLGAGYLAKYSRKHEREADEEGITLAAKAGYKPAELARGLARLEKGIEFITGNAEKQNFFSDHPYTPERVKDIEELAAKLTVTKTELLFGSQDHFLSMFKGAIVGGNPKNGAFVESLFVHPELTFSILMPQGWKKVNEPTVVAATDSAGSSGVALNIVNEKKSARELGNEMQKKVTKSKNNTIEFGGDTTINSFPAYILRVKSEKKNKVTVVEMVWIEHKSMVYLITGVSNIEQRQHVAMAIRSFNTAQPSEISMLKVRSMYVVRAQNHESIKDFSERTKNRFGVEVTQILNDLEKGKDVPIDRNIKIAVELPFRN